MIVNFPGKPYFGNVITILRVYRPNKVNEADLLACHTLEP